MTGLIKPAQMPRIRQAVLRTIQQLNRVYADPDLAAANGIREDRRQVPAIMYSALEQQMPLTELYLVSRDMTVMAVDGARDVPDATSLASAWPAPIGLMAFTGGLPPVHPKWAAGQPIVPRLLLWCPMPTGAQCILQMWGRREGGEDQPVAAVIVPDMTAPLSFDDHLSEDAIRMQSLALSAWVQMQTPTMADVTERTESGPKIGSGRRRDVPRTVRVVELRRLARKPVEPTADSGREYHHQWVVRGHWRQQPYGPGRAQRRTTWIPPYVKGPEGAPLIGSDTVFAWRR